MSKKGKGKGKPAAINWADDANFDENRMIIMIEHTEECPIFRKKAEEFKTLVDETFPNKKSVMIINQNDTVPGRDGSFEIVFSKNARASQHLLWSGVKNSPPRKNKFPNDFHDLLPEMTKILKKVEIIKIADDLLEEI